LQRFVKRHRKKIIRYGLLVANTAILVGVLMLLSNNQSSSEVARQSLQDSASAKAVANPLDQLSSADIAVNVATLTALPETNSVKNHADSFNATLTSQQVAGDVVVVKPQIVGGQTKSAKDIVHYTTVAGDTVSALAQKFGITSDSIRWSNSLTGDRLNAGKQLLIPPVNGIVYTVKAGDTVDALAQRYNTNKDLLVTFNDAELAGLRPGQVIVVPNGTPPASGGSSSFAWGGSYTAVYGSNGYDYGWCTWWAAKRRQDIGKPIPSNLGNATTWARLAQRAGYVVNGTPEAGAVAYYKFIGGLGHVGFVEQVNPDGSIWISDMNYYGVSEIGGSASAGGWGHRSFHQVQPGELGGYLFIH
jgi:surface antigen